jgi:hypothetical protein
LDAPVDENGNAVVLRWSIHWRRLGLRILLSTVACYGILVIAKKTLEISCMKRMRLNILGIDYSAVSISRKRLYALMKKNRDMRLLMEKLGEILRQD